LPFTEREQGMKIELGSNIDKKNKNVGNIKVNKLIKMETKKTGIKRWPMILKSKVALAYHMTSAAQGKANLQHHSKGKLVLNSSEKNYKETCTS
jgi:hypothetical protein